MTYINITCRSILYHAVQAPLPNIKMTMLISFLKYPPNPKAVSP